MLTISIVYRLAYLESDQRQHHLRIYIVILMKLLPLAPGSFDQAFNLLISLILNAKGQHS
jgi:hypothetical protein